MVAPESASSWQPSGVDVICFNEAGAWSPRKAGRRGRDLGLGAASMRPGHGRPGKTTRPSPAEPVTLGFNEAGAWSPRKGVNPLVDVAVLTASMRPGHGRPGKPAGRFTIRLASALQ